jgi:hypothetical protein
MTLDAQCKEFKSLQFVAQTAAQQQSSPLINVWRYYRWFTNIYNVSDWNNSGTIDYLIVFALAFDYKNRMFCATTEIKFDKGGFQGGRGWMVNDTTKALLSGPFYVDNVLGAMAHANQWFYAEKDRHLYLTTNNTNGMPPQANNLVVLRLKTLISIESTRHAPISDVTIAHIGLRDAAKTDMEPHGVPSGGGNVIFIAQYINVMNNVFFFCSKDWSLQRTAALFVSGSENFQLLNCSFERLDGNGVMLSGYNRRSSLIGNSFLWMGATGRTMYALVCSHACLTRCQ